MAAVRPCGRLATVTLVLLIAGWSGGCAAEDSPAEASTKGRADLRIMSFNVLCSFCADPDYDSWTERLPHLQGLIAQHDADLIGLQELVFWGDEEGNEAKAVIAAHPVYTAVYYVSEPGTKPPNYPDATIYYRPERFEELSRGFYWLSKTPDKPYSVGWVTSGQLWRLVAWVNLRDRWTGKELYFASTHFDPNNPNQAHSAPLVLQRVEADAGTRPAIVVGDFNADPGSVAYGTLTQGVEGEGIKLVDSREIALSTRIVHNAAQEPIYPAQKRIDHIFTHAEGLTVSDWLVDMQRFGDKNLWPSDHRLIMATLTL